MHIKSDRLKKLEVELQDLEQWLKLGLVPKKDIEKHKVEIKNLEAKIQEEKGRLQSIKESGESEEYTAPRKSAPRTGYPEHPTLPDIDVGEEATGMTDVSMDVETDSAADTTVAEEKHEDETETTEEPAEEEEEEEEDPFSDRNRWRRGMLNSDQDEW